MIPVTQTKTVVRNSNNEVVQNGNCWAAAIASILEIPLTDVPNFEVWYEHQYNGKSINGDWIWDELTKRFLFNHGYTIDNDSRFRCYHVTKQEWENDLIPDWDQPYKKFGEYELLKKELKNDFYFLSGKSARGVSHVTIWQADKMVHDPHPSREGILEKKIFEFIRPLTNEEKENGQRWDNGDKIWFPSIKNKT